MEPIDLNPSYTFFADILALLPEVPADSILSRTVFDGPDMKGTLFGFAAGQELSEHTASRAAVLHFLKGDAQLTLGQETFDAVPGSWVHMPPHLPHSIVAREPTVMLLLLMRD